MQREDILRYRERYTEIQRKLYTEREREINRDI